VGELVVPRVVRGDEVAPLQNTQRRPLDLRRRLAGLQHGQERTAGHARSCDLEEAAAVDRRIDVRDRLLLVHPVTSLLETRPPIEDRPLHCRSFVTQRVALRTPTTDTSGKLNAISAIAAPLSSSCRCPVSWPPTRVGGGSPALDKPSGRTI